MKGRDGADKTERYRRLVLQAEELVAGEGDFIANAANISLLLFRELEDVNWVGVYRLVGDELILGPFHGKPAHVRIAMGRGVCGTAAAARETVVVPNVHAFPGHIPCDTSSNAEIVVPLIKDERLLGVLDLDSLTYGRFDEEDRRGLEAIADALVRACR